MCTYSGNNVGRNNKGRGGRGGGGGHGERQRGQQRRGNGWEWLRVVWGWKGYRETTQKPT